MVALSKPNSSYAPSLIRPNRCMIRNCNPFFPGDSIVGVFIIWVALNVPVILVAAPVAVSESSSIFINVLSSAVTAIAREIKKTNDKRYFLIALFCWIAVYRNVYVYLLSNFLPHNGWNFNIII